MVNKREIIQAVPAVGAAFEISGNVVLDESSARAQTAAPFKGHFHRWGRGPSKHTLEALRRVKDSLPPFDTRDLEESRRRNPDEHSGLPGGKG